MGTLPRIAECCGWTRTMFLFYFYQDVYLANYFSIRKERILKSLSFYCILYSLKNTLHSPPVPFTDQTVSVSKCVTNKKLNIV